jgi:hypothetical protein
METRLARALALVAYQLTVLVGIVMFPLAVIVNKLGLRLPFDRVLEWLGRAAERTRSH